jgi:methyl-accepting chemotaxis protein
MDRDASTFQIMVKQCESDQVEEAYTTLQGPLNKFVNPMAAAAQEFIDIQKQELEESTAAGARKVDMARWVGVTLLALAFVVATAATWVVRGVTTSLRGIAQELGSGSHQISAASAEVASLSQNLAQGASQVAASLQETARPADK